MKTAEKWAKAHEFTDLSLEEWTRAIQADALRHAAGLVEGISFEATLDQAARVIENAARELEAK